MEGFLYKLLILSRSVCKHGPPQAIIVSGWSISKNIFSSDAAYPNEPTLGWKHQWKVLYADR
jgi:hypothetical protein